MLPNPTSFSQIMAKQQSSPGHYVSINNAEDATIIDDYVEQKHKSRRWKSIAALFVYILLANILLSFVGTILFQHFKNTRESPSTSFTSQRSCRNPSIRHEWRRLSRPQQEEYIAAVQCLRSSKSKLGLNQSIYDDFPLIHSRLGENGRSTT